MNGNLLNAAIFLILGLDFVSLRTPLTEILKQKRLSHLRRQGLDKQRGSRFLPDASIARNTVDIPPRFFERPEPLDAPTDAVKIPALPSKITSILGSEFHVFDALGVTEDMTDSVFDLPSISAADLGLEPGTDLVAYLLQRRSIRKNEVDDYDDDVMELPPVSTSDLGLPESPGASPAAQNPPPHMDMTVTVMKNSERDTPARRVRTQTPRRIFSPLPPYKDEHNSSLTPIPDIPSAL